MLEQYGACFVCKFGSSVSNLNDKTHICSIIGLDEKRTSTICDSDLVDMVSTTSVSEQSMSTQRKSLHPCTPLSKISRIIDCISDLSKCNCKSYNAWEEHCHLCLTLSRLVKDSKKIRIKLGDIIRYRCYIDDVTVPLKIGTIRTISSLDGYNAPVITFFNSLDTLSSIDNF